MKLKKSYSRKTTFITVSIFYEQYQLNKFNFEPPYQRDYNVWDQEQQSFLIDSIMKNFPMPPIFLEQKIDINGITTYDVIDGKQRLNSIVDFIDNKITLPLFFGDDLYGLELLNGKSFKEINELAKTNEEIQEFISSFWSYVINVEYIENPSNKVVDNIFDRLNRGGERLNNQELRKANYYDSIVYQHIDKLKKDTFISNMLNNLNKNRLYDVSFITELYLLIALKKVIDGSETQIDDYFKDIVENVDEKESESIIIKLNEIKDIVKYFNLDYTSYKIEGVSHLYAIWYLAYFIHKNGIEINKTIRNKFNEFYQDLRGEQRMEYTKNYHKSMQSSSKSRSSRKRRVKALLDYFGFTYEENEI